MAARFPDARLIQPLTDLLKDDDFDMRSAAVTALAQIRSPAAKSVLTEALQRETDDELRALLQDALKS